MADANIVIFGNALGGGTIAVPDNNTTALEIDSIDDKNYLAIDTTDSAERVILGGGGAHVHIGEPTFSRTLSVDGEFRVEADPSGATNDFFTVLNVSGAGSNGILGISQGDIAFRLKSSGANFGIANDSATHFAVFQDGKITTGGETTPLGADAGSIHIKTGDSGVSDASNDCDELIVEGSGNSGISILSGNSSGTTAFGGLAFGRASGEYRGGVNYRHGSSNDFLQFLTAGTTKIIVDKDGKLSTGLTSPGALCDSDGIHIKSGDSTATADNISADADDLIVEGSGNAGITILTSASGEGSLFFRCPGGDEEGSTPDGITVTKTGDNTMRFKLAGSERVRIDHNGNVGIAQTPGGSHKLEVTGTAGLSTGTAWTNTSDSRVKKDVQEITDGLEKIKQLRPVSFLYTDDYLSVHSEIDGSKRFNSFIAEEYENVFPDAVTVQGDLKKEIGPEQFETLLEDVKQFTPHDLNMYLVAAVKQLLTRIEALENGN